MLQLEREYTDLVHSERVLLGPGPSGVDPRVLRVMAAPLLGHLDPEFLQLMDETGELLRYVFQTENDLTLPMSGTGSAGMDTVLSNLLEPGDKVIVGVCGYFGQRMVDIAHRCGAQVKVIEGEWGRIIEPEQVEDALGDMSAAKLVGLVHAETSTGILQPLKEIAAIAHRHGALLVADCVTSLGGAPLKLDEWGVDAAYSGTQKCLSCPPGLSPISFNEEARKVLNSRRTEVPSWYLDLTMIERYWGKERFYHHTAPISMVYALREALRIVAEEGLEARWKRHDLNARAFCAGIRGLGLKPFAQPEYLLPSLITVGIPNGVEDGAVRQFLLQEYGIEIGGGLGPVQGQIWRVGLMGANSHRKNVTLALAALASALKEQGFRATVEEGLAAADAVYASQEDV